MNDWIDQPPPWNVFPRMRPEELGATQGAEETWLDDVWRPFWRALDAVQRQRYFERWRADTTWREAVHFVCDLPPDFDAVQDAAESQQYLQTWAAGRDHKPSLIQRLSAFWRRR